MRKIIIIIIIFSFVSCNLSEYKIANLKNRQLSFNELPLEVKNYLSNPADPVGDSYKMLVLIELSDTAIYKLETVGTLIGPWVDYEKLIDKKNGYSYRINQGVPSPYIVFENKLFIPDRFDILGVESAYEAKYIEYQLK